MMIEEPKICESCGQAFGCGAKLDGCWCTDLELAVEVSDSLKSKFLDCLCPKCLRNAAFAAEENEHKIV